MESLTSYIIQGFIILTVLNTGFLGNIRFGSGVMVARLGDNSWSPPSAIATAGGGFGGQIGIELTDFVFILNSADAVKTFMQVGSLMLGGNVSIAFGPLGRSAEIDGGASRKGTASIFSYSKTKGLFGGVSIEGTMLVERRDANQKLYDRKVKARQLLSGEIQPPYEVEPLMRVLASDAFRRRHQSRRPPEGHVELPVGVQNQPPSELHAESGLPTVQSPSEFGSVSRLPSNLSPSELHAESRIPAGQPVSELHAESRLPSDPSLSRLSSVPQFLSDQTLSELHAESRLPTNQSPSELHAESRLPTDPSPSELHVESQSPAESPPELHTEYPLRDDKSPSELQLHSEPQLPSGPVKPPQLVSERLGELNEVPRKMDQTLPSEGAVQVS